MGEPSSSRSVTDSYLEIKLNSTLGQSDARSSTGNIQKLLGGQSRLDKGGLLVGLYLLKVDTHEVAGFSNCSTSK